MRGYFGIGAERISKAMNLGAILRTAHAFNASFAFTLGARYPARDVELSDTARSEAQIPLYEWACIEDLRLPKGCVLVGVELDPDAILLPEFRHPPCATYLFGPEKGHLSVEARSRCAYLVKIPTRFCVNLAVAAAIVMYDRTINFGGHRERPVAVGGPPPLKDWRPPRGKILKPPGHNPGG